MASQKERTAPFLIWQEPCSKKRGCRSSCGRKPWRAQLTFSINAPTKIVKNKTPKEVWSGYKPSVVHLWIFGCVAYAQVPEVKRKKLSDHGEKCIFIGYNEESKAYKFYNPLTKKLVISRDVFNEKETWNLSEEETTLEQPVVDELDELPQEVLSPATPSPQHVTPSSARGYPSSGKVVAVNF